MDDNKLKEIISLKDLIDKTEKALTTISAWIQNSNERNNGGHYKNDFNYDLNISEFSDSSGPNYLDLHRYYGNTALLKVIQEELDRQLIKFKKEYENL